MIILSNADGLESSASELTISGGHVNIDASAVPVHVVSGTLQETTCYCVCSEVLQRS